MSGVMLLGRQLRRVPLDFDAPIGETWAPLLERPAHHKTLGCPVCGPAAAAAGRGHYGGSKESPHGDGVTPEMRQLELTWYGNFIGPQWTEEIRDLHDAVVWSNKLGQAEVNALIEKGRFDPVIDCPRGCKKPKDDEWEGGAWRTDCPECGGKGWTRKQLKPGDLVPAQVNSYRGHDAINMSICCRTRAKLLGFEVLCSECDGHGDIATPELRKEIDEWEPPNPPEGPGYQLWQNVTEGGPVSPVFETKEALADWLATNYQILDRSYSSSEWMKVLDNEVLGTGIETGEMVE